mmetsp:Transcript_137420/g.274210  ORF Transcript_137420/g.274210 Transcript_137420/m.274210 type:complete len:150 (-) Transcript_137420:55-504(-)
MCCSIWASKVAVKAAIADPVRAPFPAEISGSAEGTMAKSKRDEMLGSVETGKKKNRQQQQQQEPASGLDAFCTDLQEGLVSLYIGTHETREKCGNAVNDMVYGVKEGVVETFSPPPANTRMKENVAQFRYSFDEKPRVQMKPKRNLEKE